MKLLTKEIERKLTKTPYGTHDGLGDAAPVIVKFFGGSAATWLITEGDKLPNGDWLLFGCVTLGYGWEWGTVLLSELQAARFPPFGLGVERDLYFSGTVAEGKCA